MLVQQRKPFHQHRAAFLGGLGAPQWPGFFGRSNRGRAVDRAQVGDLRQFQACGRVVDGKACVAGLARHPGAAQQRIGLQQAGVGQAGQR